MIFDLQKASLSKRASAFLFDFIIFCIVAVGVSVLMSAIVGYDGKIEDLKDYYLKYEEEYKIDIDISDEEYNKLHEDEKARYDAASDAFAKDPEVNKLYLMILNLTFIIITSSVLLSYVILEMFVPLFLKNGQTLGKKIFGIALMRTDGVRVTNFQVFVRAILGKFTIETMLPILLIMMLFLGVMGGTALMVIFLLIVLEIVVMVASRRNSMIHDLFAVTVAVDIHSQMIFESAEQMLEYKKQHAKQLADEQVY